MAGFGGPVVVHHGKGGADHTIDFSGFAATVTLAVKGRELSYQIGREVRLSTHEHAFPGHEDVIKNQGRAVLGVECVPDIAAVQLAHVQGGSADHVNQSLCIGWNGKG